MKKYIIALIPALILSAVPVFADTNTTEYKDTMNVNKTAAYNYATHEGLITLESFVPGEMVVTAQSKPLDVVLVLDFSSSMTDPYSTKESFSIDTLKPVTYNMYKYGYTGSSSKYQKYHYFGTEYQVSMVHVTKSTYKNWAYITMGGKRYYLQKDGSAIEAQNDTDPTDTSYPKDTKGNTIYPSMIPDTVVYSDPIPASLSTNKRYLALYKGAQDFIQALNANAQESGIQHRLSMVQFQQNKWPRFGGATADTAKYIKPGEANYLKPYFLKMQSPGDLAASSVLCHYQSISTNNDARHVASLMTGMPTWGITAPSYGMKMAKLMIDSYSRSDVAKVVILFSDGRPVIAKNTSEGSGNWGQWTDAAVQTEANLAVKYGNELKNAGTYIYSIYCNTDSDTTNSIFLKNVSSCNTTSNLYSNTTWSASKYYKRATTNLAVVFQELAQDIIQTIVSQYDSKTIMKDFINNAYFKLPEDVNQSNVYEKVFVYENPLEAFDSTATTVAAKYTFSQTRRKLDHVKDSITIRLTKASTTTGEENDKIEVLGYDYSKNWCGWDKKNNKVHGNRLVIEIPFVFTGGEEVSGDLPTNTEDSGVYPVKKDESGQVVVDPTTGEPVYEEKKAYPVPVIKFSKVKIQRADLDPGESAIYTVYMKDTSKPDSDSTFVCRISINGERDADTVSRTIYGLQGGPGIYYTVTETMWNWAYTKKQAQIRKEVNTTETAVIFPFSGSHKPGTGEDPAEIHNHDEVYKLNIFDLSNLPLFVPYTEPEEVKIPYER